MQAVSQEEPSDRKPDPWPLWMAGHAQLKFVMTECSKAQIRLTRPIWCNASTTILRHVNLQMPWLAPWRECHIMIRVSYGVEASLIIAKQTWRRDKHMVSSIIASYLQSHCGKLPICLEVLITANLLQEIHWLQLLKIYSKIRERVFC